MHSSHRSKNSSLLPFPVLGAAGTRLLRIAQALRARTPAQAKGYCFASSLEFSLAARQEGIYADVVVWSVRGDPDFLEHWAVSLGKDQVIDLTRQQVDGRNGVQFAIDDYPANFVRPRVYPARLFLPDYEARLNNVEVPREQFSFAQLFRWRGLMLRHEAGQVSLSQVPRVLFAAASLAKMLVVGALQCSTAALQRRRDQLVCRAMAMSGSQPAMPVRVRSRQAAANDGTFGMASPAGKAATFARHSRVSSTLDRPLHGVSCGVPLTQSHRGTLK